MSPSPSSFMALTLLSLLLPISLTSLFAIGLLVTYLIYRHRAHSPPPCTSYTPHPRLLARIRSRLPQRKPAAQTKNMRKVLALKREIGVEMERGLWVNAVGRMGAGLIPVGVVPGGLMPMEGTVENSSGAPERREEPRERGEETDEDEDEDDYTLWDSTQLQSCRSRYELEAGEVGRPGKVLVRDGISVKYI